VGEEATTNSCSECGIPIHGGRFCANPGGADAAAENAAMVPNDSTMHKQQVAKVFGPVLGANRLATDKLTALRGTKPDDARLVVRCAEKATTQATGAPSALTIPADQEKFAADAKQFIGREAAYPLALASVLNHPTIAGRARLQSLESDLNAAFTAPVPSAPRLAAA
jgi:hypothetical protein